MAVRSVRSQLRRELLRQDKILKQEIAKEVNEAAFALSALLTASVRSWKNKPKFSPDVRVEPHEIRGDVKITGKTKDKNVFGWVDRGTGKFGPKKQAYKIPKVPNANITLRFRLGYKPKTKAIAKGNVGPGKATGPWVSAKQVTHPGIKAREFTSTLVENLSPDWKRRSENALKRAARRIKR